MASENILGTYIRELFKSQNMKFLVFSVEIFKSWWTRKGTPPLISMIFEYVKNSIF